MKIHLYGWYLQHIRVPQWSISHMGQTMGIGICISPLELKGWLGIVSSLSLYVMRVLVTLNFLVGYLSISTHITSD